LPKTSMIGYSLLCCRQCQYCYR